MSDLIGVYGYTPETITKPAHALRVGMVFMESPAHPAVIIGTGRVGADRRKLRRLKCRYIWQDESEPSWALEVPRSATVRVALPRTDH